MENIGDRIAATEEYQNALKQQQQINRLRKRKPRWG